MNWRLQDMAHRFGPILLFICTAGLVYLMMGSPSAPGRHVIGFAETVTLKVAPLSSGTLLSLNVRPGQAVTAGEIVASLDPKRLDQEIVILQLEIQGLQAKQASELTSTLRQELMDEHTLSDEAQDLQLILAREKDTLKTAQLEVDSLSHSVERLSRLRDQKLTTQDELAQLTLKLDKAKRITEDHPALIQVVETQFKSAKTRSQRHQTLFLSKQTDPIESALLAAQQRLLLLEGRRDDLQLRAPAAGRITTIQRYPGEVVAAGENIVNVVRTDVTEIVACLRESQALSVELGRKATITPRSGQNPQPLMGEVISLGPLMEELPIRCRKIAAIPTRGREVILHLTEAKNLLPGQRFRVEFVAIDNSGIALAADLRREDTNMPSPLNVPRSLSRISRFEPSGLIWQKHLDAYLVISDDTGFKKQNEHSPWLFTLDQGGNVGADILPIAGLAEVNDLEAISQGPGDSVYLLSSQNRSSSGKRPASRTALLKVTPTDDGYALEDQVALAPLLEALSKAEQKSLGLLDGTQDLDIEGMTYHQGQLYFGLKTPTDKKGRAIVWRVTDPNALLEGDIQGAGLSLFAHIDLSDTRKNKRIPGGISDMLFEDDSTLILASTPSSGGSKGGPMGKLWRVDLLQEQPKSGVFQADLLRTWKDDKPEGIVIPPDGMGILVVFDAGSKNPQWEILP